MGFTANQWAILGLVLVLGWILGLLSRQGAGPVRRQLRAEEARRIATEHELATARTRITELERARTTTAVAAPAVAPAAPVTPAAVPLDSGTSRAPLSTATGADDLTRIDGIDGERAARLHALGVRDFADLASLSDTDAATIESRIGLAPGAIAHERWREQAAELGGGRRSV